MCLRKEAKESDSHAIVVENFPKLEFAGVFELVYSESWSRELKLIPPGPEGLTIEYMVPFIGRSKVYIRPIQESLPLESLHRESFLESNVQREMFNNCMELIDLHKLREHSINCKVEVQSSSDRDEESISLLNSYKIPFYPKY